MRFIKRAGDLAVIVRRGVTIIRRLNGRSLLAFAGMAGPLVLAATDLSAGLSEPAYSYLNDSISSLALTKLGWVQTIGFLAIGLLVEIFVAGLLFNIRRARGFHLSIALLVFFGFGLLLVGAFRTDPVGTPHTTEGIIHVVVSMLVFWLFPIAILILAPSLRRDPTWRGITLYTVVTGVLALLLVSALVILDRKIGWFGLMERIVVANLIIWVEVAAIKLLLISVKRE